MHIVGFESPYIVGNELKAFILLPVLYLCASNIDLPQTLCIKFSHRYWLCLEARYCTAAAATNAPHSMRMV